VTSIGNRAFYGCSNLVSVTIPENVRSIGARSFAECVNLTDLFILSDTISWKEEFIYSYVGFRELTVAVYQNRAFENCNNLNHVEIPYGLTSIGSCAFIGCSRITSVVMPGCFKPSDVFSDSYSKITDLVVTEGEETLCDDFAERCSALASVELPASLTTIGARAFAGCHILASVELPESASLTSIGANAFQGCTTLASVELPESLTSIGDNAFQGCTALASVVLPASLASIGANAFQGCTALASVELPESASLTSIGASAFAGCFALASVELPASLTSIGASAFQDCVALQNVDFQAVEIELGENAFAGCKGIVSACVPQNLVLTTLFPDSYATLNSLSFAPGVTAITNVMGISACTALVSVTTPDSVTSVGENAFGNLAALEYAVLGGGVTDFHPNAFQGCSALRELFCEFQYSSALAKKLKEYLAVALMLPGKGWENTDFQVFDDGIVTLKGGANNELTLDNVCLVGLTVENIGGEEWLEVKKETLGVKQELALTYVSPSAGNENSAILRLTAKNCKDFTFDLPITMTALENGVVVMQLLDYVYIVNFVGDETELVISDEVNGMKINGILDDVFKGNQQLVSISLPMGIRELPDGLFAGCSNLQYVKLPEEASEFPADIFADCNSLSEVVLPRQMTEIPAGHFQNSSITKIDLPDCVTTIGDSAFAGCRKLKSVTLSRNLAHIGENAFQLCAGLTTLRFPACEIEIGAGAFSGCNKLTDAFFTGYPPKYLGTGKLFPAKDALIRAYRYVDHYVSTYSYKACTFSSHNSGWEWQVVNGQFAQVACQLEDWPSCDGFAYRSDCRECAWLQDYSPSNSEKLEIVVPEELDGHPVYRLGPGALRNLAQEKTQGVWLPSGLSEIADYVFNGVSTLKSVVFTSFVPMKALNKNCYGWSSDVLRQYVPETEAWAEAIGVEWTYGGKPVSFYGLSEEGDVLGYRVQENGSAIITGWARYANPGTMTIPAIVNDHMALAIAEGAFSGNDALTEVVIPDAVQEIPARAFEKCTSLTKVTLPYKLQDIDESAFNYCDALETLYFPGTPDDAMAWLAFMPAVTLHVFADQGWSEELDEEGTFYGLPVEIGGEANLAITADFDILDNAAGEEQVHVSTGGAWTAESNVPWLRLKTSTGIGNAELRFEFDDNAQSTDRVGVISVRIDDYGLSKSIDIIQERFQFTEGEVKYVLADGVACVTGSRPKGTTLIIPGILGGCPVGRVANGAFKRATEVTSLVFQGTVPAYEGEEALLTAVGASVKAFRSNDTIAYGWDGMTTFGGLPVNLVDQDTSEDGQWLYCVNASDEILLVQYLGAETALEIPEELDGRYVAGVWGYGIKQNDEYTVCGAFQGNAYIKQLSFPKGSDDLYAGFKGCTALKNILFHGAPPVVSGNGILFPANGAHIHAFANFGWEDALDEDGTFHGTPITIHPDTIKENTLASQEFDGGDMEFSITALDEWRLEGLPDWVLSDKTAGAGNNTIQLSFQENPGALARSAIVRIMLKCGLEDTVVVSQAGQVPRHLTTVHATADVPTGIKGTAVSLQAVLPEGEEVANLRVLWESDTECGLTAAEDGLTASLVLPASNVTVTARFLRRLSLTTGWNLLCVSREFAQETLNTLDELGVTALRDMTMVQLSASELRRGEGFWIWTKDAREIWLKFSDQDTEETPEEVLEEAAEGMMGLPDSRCEMKQSVPEGVTLWEYAENNWRKLDVESGAKANLVPYRGYMLIRK